MKHPSVLALFLLTPFIMIAQNYDESKIPAYTLPKLLTSQQGKIINSKQQWEQFRRDEILTLFKQQMYGAVPEFDYDVSYSINTLTSPNPKEYTQEEVNITIGNSKNSVTLSMLLTMPTKANGPVPVFLGLNFRGNQATTMNPEVAVTNNYVIGNSRPGIEDNRASEESRGSAASRWQLEQVIKSGFGVATIHCGDIDPDFDDGFKNGVHALLSARPEADQWGTVAAWAWGLSKGLDYLLTDRRVDGNKVAAIGHSRLGKAALWAGATDQRFALVISNDSGCGGAALSRRRIGETVEAINTRFPHWFCKNFHQYNNNEDQLPIDQHMLISLIAPRPVYVASAQDDQWADPKGEYLSLYHSGPVYQLYGVEIIESQELPAVDQPVEIGMQGYHIRTGKHDINSYDWQQYLNFASSHFSK